MPISNVTLNTKFKQWKDITNLLISHLGDKDTLSTNVKTNLVAAINEVDGNNDTNAANIATNTSDITTNSNSIGTLTNLTTSDKSNLVAAINEVDLNNDTNASNISTNASGISNNATAIGTLGNLTTDANTNLVDAINEVDSNIDTFISNSESVTAGITAFATGGQGSAVEVTSRINEISVCATIGDSVKLPTATAGSIISIINNGATDADVFPATGEDIGAGTNTPIALTAGSGVTYASYAAGNWRAV